MCISKGFNTQFYQKLMQTDFNKCKVYFTFNLQFRLYEIFRCTQIQTNWMGYSTCRYYCLDINAKKLYRKMDNFNSKPNRNRVKSIYCSYYRILSLFNWLMLISSFVVIFIIGEPVKEGFMLFFIGILLFFWVTYITRFNYIIYMKYKQ